jgi:hypothetical protein
MYYVTFHSYLCYWNNYYCYLLIIKITLCCVLFVCECFYFCLLHVLSL